MPIFAHKMNSPQTDTTKRIKGPKEALLQEQQVELHPLAGTTRQIPFPPPLDPKFTFIDLFAGIGGFRIAMQSVGGQCVFSSEWDKNAQETYQWNFGKKPYGDITLPEIKEMIPSRFDVLCAGFPCQAFSIAGYRKGFEDTRGTLFFEIVEIATKHRPKVLFLENVKNLQNHDKGNTFATIMDSLYALGYTVAHKVMNAMTHANIPQNRERIFIVAIDPEQVPLYNSFAFPSELPLLLSVEDCIDESSSSPLLYYNNDNMKHFGILQEEVTSKKTLYQWRRKYVRENKSNVCPTLTANMGTGGHNVPIIRTDYGIRKLSPRECLNFQGFPKEFTFPNTISLSSKYKQAGNSVVVPLVKRICQQIEKILPIHS